MPKRVKLGTTTSTTSTTSSSSDMISKLPNELKHMILGKVSDKDALHFGMTKKANFDPSALSIQDKYKKMGRRRMAFEAFKYRAKGRPNPILESFLKRGYFKKEDLVVVEEFQQLFEKLSRGAGNEVVSEFVEKAINYIKQGGVADLHIEHLGKQKKEVGGPLYMFLIYEHLTVLPHSYLDPLIDFATSRDPNATFYLGRFEGTVSILQLALGGVGQAKLGVFSGIRKYKDAVIKLLERGANPNRRNERGIPDFYRNMSVSLLDPLIKHGARLDKYYEENVAEFFIKQMAFTFPNEVPMYMRYIEALFEKGAFKTLTRPRVRQLLQVINHHENYDTVRARLMELLHS